MQGNNSDFRILIIEDNPGDFTLTEDFLEEQFKSPCVLHAWNFGEAKKILASRGPRFDIILVDLSLPDKQGELLIVEILALCGSIPVIVLTGYSDVSFGVKSLALGIIDYVVKEDLTSTMLYKSIIYSIERKRNILALEESEKRYSELFQFSPSPMFVFDNLTLRIVNVNDAAIDHYGYSRDEFLSMNINQLGPGDDAALLEQPLLNSYKNQMYLTGTCQHQRKNGETRHVEIRDSDIPYKGNDAKVILVVDVTERINYIREIEKQNRTLKEISWIQSHVVRAPLARLMGLLQVFQECSSPCEKDRIVDYLLCSANELDGSIRDITNKIQINSDEKSTCPS